MSTIKRFTIPAPIDPELELSVRDNLEYYMVFPENYDLNKEYGLCFCITGYGWTSDMEYYKDKLCPYISDTYNLITVGIRYHNDERVSPNSVVINLPAISNCYQLGEDYFKNLTGSQIIESLFKMLVERKLFSLDPRLALSREAFHKYSSFGFMPAIEHLCVLYSIISTYKIDRSNIIAYGSSYGGYIANLMAKYAPNTFSLVIDNSGFCVAQLNEILGSQINSPSGSTVAYVDNRRYEIPYNSSTVWSIDETSPNYFGDSNKKIRNLLVEDHRTPSDTFYCIYHSEKDEIAPISLKDKMCETLSKYNKVVYKRITEADVDGKLFKDSSHGMNASLRELFNVSYSEYLKSGVKKQTPSDFDLNVNYGFVCSDKVYNFNYTKDGLFILIEKIDVE